VYLYTEHLNKKSQGAESQQNKNVFRSRLNSLRHTSRCRSSTGRLFHSRGPATAKVLSPSCVCVRGTAQAWTSADRMCRRPRSVRLGSPPTDTVVWDREGTCIFIQCCCVSLSSSAVSSHRHQHGVNGLYIAHHQRFRQLARFYNLRHHFHQRLSEDACEPPLLQTIEHKLSTLSVRKN